MPPFRFRLEKVLEWRREQLELEEENFRRQLAILRDLDRQCAELEAAGSAAERVVRAWNPVAGGELGALGSFRLHIKARETEMAVPRNDARRRLAAQHAVVLEARRRLRLLEKLRERRLAEWRAARDKELEQTASDSYLARWGSKPAAGNQP